MEQTNTITNIRIKSCDSDEFHVMPLDVAIKSTFLKNMIDDMRTGGITDIEIVLDGEHKIEEETLKKVIEYCEHYTYNEPMPEPYKYKDVHSEWDKEFYPKENMPLQKLIMASSFLDIPSLYSCVCMAFANDWIADRTVEELRQILNVENDFTPEEEEKLREEFAWAREE